MVAAYCISLLHILVIFSICIRSNLSLLTHVNLICDNKLNLNDMTKNDIHIILSAVFNKSILHNTNEIYSTKLCPLHKNSKYYILIDYKSLCVHIPIDIDIIWKHCRLNAPIQDATHLISAANSRSLLQKQTPEPTQEPTSEPTPEPTIEPTIEPTQEPTQEPTNEPTQEPTQEPTLNPTEMPTLEPTAEPTRKIIVTFFPTTEPTQASQVMDTTSTTQETETSRWDAMIQLWNKYRYWIILGAAFLFLIILLLIYFLCATYRCCCNKPKPQKVNSVSKNHQRDRHSYASIESDDDTNGKKKKIELIALHKHGNKQDQRDKSNKKKIKYQAIATDNYKSDHDSDEKSDEKDFILTETKKDYNDSQNSSDSRSILFKQSNAKVTPQFTHDIPDVAHGMDVTPGSNKQVVINIHHYGNDPMSEIASISPQAANIAVQASIQANLPNDNIPTNLPNLPQEMWDIVDTNDDTELPGEGFDLDSWIMQTLKQCAPDDDEWKEYWNNFRKHKIKEDVLVALITDKNNKHHEWKELIPAIGPRIRFQQEWEKELLRQQQTSI